MQAQKSRIRPLSATRESSNLSSLQGLLPFLGIYKFLILLASVTLILTAALSLILPMAVRQVVDNFLTSKTGVLDSYFAMALVIAGLLAVGTALRYLLVTRLGERVVVDIRKAVFDRMTNMSS